MRALRAPADAVYAAENVTQAFAQFVGALGRARLNGKRVLIAADCFPSLHYMLTGLAPLLGYTLDTVPVDAAAGYVTDDGYIARWQDDVALAIITLVTSTASKRAGLQRLAAHGRAQGSLIAVDITQAAGIVDVDVSAPAIDFAATTTLKRLCGAPGSGLAYINPALLDERLQPLVQGWFSQPDPFNWDLDKYSLATQARRFDNGTPSFLPYVASAPGLSWLLSPAAQGMRAQPGAVAQADRAGRCQGLPAALAARCQRTRRQRHGRAARAYRRAGAGSAPRNRGRAGRHARPGAAPVAGRADAGRRDRRMDRLLPAA